MVYQRSLDLRMYEAFFTQLCCSWFIAIRIVSVDIKLFFGDLPSQTHGRLPHMYLSSLS